MFTHPWRLFLTVSATYILAALVIILGSRYLY